VNTARIVGTRVEIVSSLAASQAECRRFDPDRPLHSLHDLKPRRRPRWRGAAHQSRRELVKHIERHAPALGAKIIGVETIDHPTDGELVAHARRYFKNDHQMEPRVQ
jgi:hypothetical protein